MFVFIKNIKKWINNIKQNKIEKTMYDISAEIVRRDDVRKQEGLSDEEILSRHNKFNNIDEYHEYINRCRNLIKYIDSLKIARMFHKGYSVEKIVKLTGFSEDTIREMVNDILGNWGNEDYI